MPDIGDTAPDAAFTHPDGTAGKISDFKGKALVVYFYPKDATSGCTREAQDFTAFAADFAAANTVVLGISKDSEKSHAKFIEKYDLNVKLGTDGDGSLCDAFGVWVKKSMYGREYMGIERATFLIDAGGVIRQVWRKVKVAGHAEAVLTAARGLS